MYRKAFWGTAATSFLEELLDTRPSLAAYPDSLEAYDVIYAEDFRAQRRLGMAGNKEEREIWLYFARVSHWQGFFWGYMYIAISKGS